MDRRTRAPAPSDCSVAKKALRIARGTVIFTDFGALKNARVAVTGKPLKRAVVLSKKFVIAFS